jgi:hypothetical protein
MNRSLLLGREGRPIGSEPAEFARLREVPPPVGIAG